MIPDPDNNNIAYCTYTVSVGFTLQRTTVSPSRSYAYARISVLTGILRQNVTMNCRTENGTARGDSRKVILLTSSMFYTHFHTAFTDYTPVDTVVTLTPQMPTFQLSISLRTYYYTSYSRVFYVRLTLHDELSDVVITTPLLTITVASKFTKN